jgi:hypothetical protein
VVTARAWAQPRGHADIAPSRFERLERDGYFTIDAGWIIPALCCAVQIEGPILEPCAGRGHMVRELRARGFVVRGADLYAYADTLVPDIKSGEDVFDLKSLAGYRFIVTNLPYREQAAILAHLLPIAARDGVSVAVLARSEWSSAKARRVLVHENPWFAGEVWTCPGKVESSSEGKRSISWASRSDGSGRNSKPKPFGWLR